MAASWSAVPRDVRTLISNPVFKIISTTSLRRISRRNEKFSRGIFERKATVEPVAVSAGQMQRRVRVDRSPVGRVGRHQLGVALQQEADRVDPAPEKTRFGPYRVAADMEGNGELEF